MKRARTATAAALLVASAAHAGAREETSGKQAIARAQVEHAARHYDRALAILSTAEKACEPDKCTPATLAALLRDIGTMQLLEGDEVKARSNFSAALSFDSAIDINSAYAASDVRAIWNSVKSPSSSGAEQQPSGDFDHTPPTEQKKEVPLPLYVEYHGSAHPASVVVRYQGAGMTAYKRLQLSRVGRGFGAVIPCGAVKLGTLRYYFQGFDGEGLPILDGGDKRHPYSVPIRPKLEGSAPHLPGHRAPSMCGEGAIEEEHEETAARSSESTAPTETPKVDARSFARIWIGLSGAVDFTVLPAGTNVCTRGADGSPSDPNWSCTSDTPEGIDFPASTSENSSIVQNKGGSVTGGVQPANVRVKLTLDYAVTQNLLLGVAVGYVAGAYQGGIAPRFIPLHIEARATWVFGGEPLTHVGFAPFVQLAGGVAEYDANLTILVAQAGVAGGRPVQAWHVGGPGFVALEGGARFTFSARLGLMLGIRGTAAFGASLFPAFGPDLTLQVGL